MESNLAYSEYRSSKGEDLEFDSPEVRWRLWELKLALQGTHGQKRGRFYEEILWLLELAKALIEQNEDARQNFAP